MLAAWTLAAAAPQAGSGEVPYRRHCQSCHALEAGRNTAAGPTLFGIVGRRIAAERGFNYSPAMRRLGTGSRRWTAVLLDAFLANPERIVPGTEMSFPGIRNETERRAVIDLLARQNRRHDQR